MEDFLESIPELNDSTTRAALYSAFKERELNPEGYDWKFRFWKHAMLNAMRNRFLRALRTTDGNMFCFTKKELEKGFTFHNSYPLVFDTLVLQLKRENCIKEETLFERSASQEPTPTFASKLYRLAKYASSLFRLESSLSTVDVEQPFVFMELVLEYADKVQEWLNDTCHSSCDCVFTERQLRQWIASMFPDLNEAETRTIFQCMIVEGRIYACQLESGQPVYYLPRNGVDKIVSAVGLLKLSVENLHLQMNRLDDALVSVQLKLTTFVQSKARNSAMLELKRKHALENNLTKVRNSFATLEGQLIAIDSAQTDSFLYDSMMKGLQTSKQVMAHSNVEEYAELVEELKQLKAEQREVSQAIASSPTSEDEGVEEEYLKLLAENEPVAELDDIMRRLEGLKVEKRAEAGVEKDKVVAMT